jgi:hypothetical protein
MMNAKPLVSKTAKGCPFFSRWFETALAKLIKLWRNDKTSRFYEAGISSILGCSVFQCRENVTENKDYIEFRRKEIKEMINIKKNV